MYHVETQERNYNSVNSPKQFKVVRKNRNDYSPVVNVFEWINPHGWVPIDSHDFETESN